MFKPTLSSSPPLHTQKNEKKIKVSSLLVFKDWLSVYNSSGFDLRFTNNKVFVAALHVNNLDLKRQVIKAER